MLKLTNRVHIAQGPHGSVCSLAHPVPDLCYLPGLEGGIWTNCPVSPETTDQRWHHNETGRERPCDTALPPEARATSPARRGSEDPTGAARRAPAWKHRWEQTWEENEGTRTGQKKIKFTFLKHLLRTREYGTYFVYLLHFHPYKILRGTMWLYIIPHRERSSLTDEGACLRTQNWEAGFWPQDSDTKVHSPPGSGGRTKSKMSGNKLAMKKENAQPSRKEQWRMLKQY